MLEPQIKKKKRFSKEEELELKEHFKMEDRSTNPTRDEIDTFLGSCTYCKNRNIKSIQNKLHYMLRYP